MIQFISTNKLKSNYLIDDNMDDNYIKPIIVKCQDFIIYNLLGDSLYNEISQQLTGDTLTEINENLLLNYIQPIIAYYVQSEVVYATAYKLKNQGVETGDSYRFSELVKISNKYMNDCNQYQQRLKEYVIEEGINIFQEKQTIKIGMYLGKGLFRNPNELPDKKH